MIKCPEEDKTNALILLLDGDLFEAAQYLRIDAKAKSYVAKQKLKDYFAITETKEELIDKLDLRRQEHGESIESFARDIKLIAHRAKPKVTDNRILESIMIKVFTSGLRDDRSRERVILQTPKTLTEAAQYARFSAAAVRVARGHSAPPPSISVYAMNFYNRNTWTAWPLFLWKLPRKRPFSVPRWILSAKSELQQWESSKTPFSFSYEKLLLLWKNSQTSWPRRHSVFQLQSDGAHGEQLPCP